MKGRALDKKYVVDKFEQFRSKDPVIYNIETTNVCNMRCVMCARTTKMTRQMNTLDMDIYKRVVEQIKPFPQDLWAKWKKFVVDYYGIRPDEMGENHFFLYVIAKSIVMHGFGEPLLDPKIAERIRFLSEKNIPSYFSCNPANIHIDKVLEIFESGLDYFKLSIDSVDDDRQRKVRGDASGFTGNYKKIIRLLDEKKEHGYKTTVVLTMLNLNIGNAAEEFEKLKKLFEGRPVYLYFKCPDNQWYRGTKQATKAIHWLEFCQAPWSTLSIQANGDISACGAEDYNGELIVGNAQHETLADAWNSGKFRKFREDHFNVNKEIKCAEECDMRLIGELVKN